MSSETWYNSDGSIESQHKYRRRFDEHGNSVSEVVTKVFEEGKRVDRLHMVTNYKNIYW